jgi:mRNA interferase MazF
VRRREVWLVDFGSPRGPEQAGKRPAIVVQRDDLTEDMVTVIVIPITSNLERLAIPTCVRIPSGEAGLTRDSVALCHHVQVRGKAWAIERLGELSAERMAEIDDKLQEALGL